MIVIEQNNDNISFEGITKVTPYKFGYIAKETITGKTIQQYVAIKNKLNIDISFISQTQYDILKELWESGDDVFITTERNDYYKVKFNTENLDMTVETDYDGSIFYYGTLEFVE